MADISKLKINERAANVERPKINILSVQIISKKFANFRISIVFHIEKIWKIFQALKFWKFFNFPISKFLKF